MEIGLDKFDYEILEIIVLTTLHFTISRRVVGIIVNVLNVVSRFVYPLIDEPLNQLNPN